MKKMRKLKNIALSVFAFALAFIMASSPVLAYDWATDEFTDDGYFIVDNYKNRGNTVTLFLYVDENDRDCMYNKSHYLADCVAGEAIPDGYFSATVIYQWWSENKEVYDTLDGGEIWVFEFSLEDGTYQFSHPAGVDTPLNQPSIYTLTTDFQFPTFPEDYDPRVDIYGGEERVLDGSTPIHLYAIYGHSDFREAHWEEFAVWAKEHELGYIEDKNNSNVESTETIIVEEESTEAPAVEATPEPTRVPEATKEPVVVPEITPEPAEKSGGLPVGAIVGVGAVAAAGGAAFVFLKKR